MGAEQLDRRFFTERAALPLESHPWFCFGVSHPHELSIGPAGS